MKKIFFWLLAIFIASPVAFFISIYLSFQCYLPETSFVWQNIYCHNTVLFILPFLIVLVTLISAFFTGIYLLTKNFEKRHGDKFWYLTLYTYAILPVMGLLLMLALSYN